MQKNQTLVIERVGNGYQVRKPYETNTLLIPSEVFVFQDKGVVCSTRNYQPIEETLFGWLDRHFADVPRETVTDK